MIDANLCHVLVYTDKVYAHLEKKGADAEKLRTFKEKTKKESERWAVFAITDMLPQHRLKSAWWRKDALENWNMVVTSQHNRAPYYKNIRAKFRFLKDGLEVVEDADEKK